MKKIILLFLVVLTLISCSKKEPQITMSDFEKKFNELTFEKIELNVLNRPEFKEQKDGYSAMYNLDYGRMMVSGNKDGIIEGIVLELAGKGQDDSENELLLYIHSLIGALSPKLNNDNKKIGNEMYNFLINTKNGESKKEIGDFTFNLQIKDNKNFIIVEPK